MKRNVIHQVKMSGYTEYTHLSSVVGATIALRLLILLHK